MKPILSSQLNVKPNFSFHQKKFETSNSSWANAVERFFFALSKLNFNLKKSFVLAMFLMIALSSFSQFKTYYVSTSGSDNNTGLSTTAAWKTISKVSSFAFQAGDKVLFEGGQTFIGNLYIQFGKVATSYSSYGNGRAIINGGNSYGIYAYNVACNISNFIIIGSGVSTNTAAGILFYMDKSSTTANITVSNCNVSGFKNAGIQFGVYNTSYGYNNVKITNVSCHDNGHAGISIYGNVDQYNSTNFYLAYDTTYNNLGNTAVTTTHTGNGIIVSGLNGFLIEHCLAYGNGINNRNNGGGPVGIWCWNAKNGTIQYCESHHNKAGLQADGGGFDIDGGSQNCVLQYNYSHDNEGAGFALFEYGSSNQFTNDTIRYNISENDGLKNGYGSLSFWAENSANKIINSVVYNNVFYASNPIIGAAIYVQNSNISNVKVFNNVFYCVGVAMLKGDPSTISWQKNNYYSTGTANFTTGGTTFNPGFVSAGTGPAGYKLQAKSPMIDLGSPNSCLKDYYNNATPQGAAIDIGAYEAQAIVQPVAAIVQPVTSTVASLSSLRINAGSAASLTTSRGVFSADQFYSASTLLYSTNSSIAGTADQALYQKERYSANGIMNYAIPVTNGTYTVVLHFAEIYWSKAGQRRFDVSIEGNKVLNDYDILQKVAPLTATTETFQATVSDGTLNINFSALAADGGTDQAKVSAIEVLPATTTQRAIFSNATTTEQSSIMVSNGQTLNENKGDFKKLNFGINIFPVPSTSVFNISLKSSDVSKVSVNIFDNMGRIIEVKNNLQIGETIQIGNTYKPGIYIIEALQGNEKKVIRIIKQ